MGVSAKGSITSGTRGRSLPKENLRMTWKCRSSFCVASVTGKKRTKLGYGRVGCFRHDRGEHCEWAGA